MRLQVQRRLSPLAFALLLAGMPGLGWGGGGGLTGGATEITQLLNNGELLALNGQQAAQVAESVKQTMTQVQQYATMVKHLQQGDPAQLLAALTPYQQQYADLTKLLGTVNSISTISKQLSTQLTGNAQDMAAMNMTPAKYLQWMVTQSKNRQGMYAQKLQQELQTISAFEQRYKALQQIQQSVPGIDGQVKGLQALTQTMSMATGELMDLRLAVQQQQAMVTQQKMADEASVIAREEKGQQDSQSNTEALNSFGGALQGRRMWK